MTKGSDKWGEWLDVQQRNLLKPGSIGQLKWDATHILNSNAVAIWVFDSTVTSLLFCAGLNNLRSYDKIGQSRSKVYRSRQRVFFSIASVISSWANTRFQVPSDTLVNEIQKKPPIKQEIPDLDQFNHLFGNCALAAFQIDNMHVCYMALCDENGNFRTPRAKAEKGLAASLRLYFQKNPTKSFIPKIFQDFKHSSPKQLSKAFWNPKLRYIEGGKNDFGWPWQQEDENGNPLSVPTVSLCIDLRNSTRAMELCNDPAEFAIFIRNAIDLMKEAVRSNGGFFDKETGDGIIAHFARIPISKNERVESGTPEIQAMQAAFSARVSVKKLARDFVLNNCKQFLACVELGAGIHSDYANWFVDQHQIRAIGQSVVWASRLCGNAGKGEVLLSLNAVRSADLIGGLNREYNYEIRPISFKEHPEGLSGYVFK